MLGNFSQYFLKLEVSCLQDPPEILRKVQQKLPFVLKILWNNVESFLMDYFEEDFFFPM